jgi:3-oxoacyl-[acyl-carrier-protein] synthase-3
MSIRAVVQGCGHGLPTKVLTNSDLEKLVDTSDEWIVQRTGIKERRICAPGESTGSLTIQAAQEALKASNISAEELDLVIVGTVTGEFIWPSTACYVQDQIGAKNAGAFDISAACAGFIYSLQVGAAMIESGVAKTILVLGVDCLSKQLDYTDRSTCILFGDAAAGVVLRGEENTDRGVLKTVLRADGDGLKHINLEVGGNRYPTGSPEAEGHRHKLFMAGSEVYRFAVNAMSDACLSVLSQAGMTADEIDLFVPHQANLRIIKSSAEKLGLPDEKVFVNVHKYGNTSGGSIPLALYEAEKEGRLKKGDAVLTVGFGAGLVWGANIIRW